MDKRITNISEIAAYGLKNDAELYLAVRREIEDHLATSVEIEEARGTTENEAIEKAIAQFGSPASAAADVLEANKRRLKFRARCHLLLMGILPVVALSVCVWQAKESLNTLILKRTPDWKHTSDIKVLARNVGINFDKLPQKSRWLLVKDWTELHNADPNDKVWSACNFLNTIETSGWTNGKPMYTDIDYQVYDAAVKLDPDNALYDYHMAGKFLYLATHFSIKNRRSETKLVDKFKLMQALPYFLRGLKKQYYDNYSNELKKRYMKLKKSGKYIHAEIWNKSLLSVGGFDWSSAELVSKAFPIWVEELIKNGMKQQAVHLLDCWIIRLKQYAPRGLSPADYIWKVHFTTWGEHKKIIELYKKLNCPDRVEQTQKYVDQICGFAQQRFIVTNANIPEDRKKVINDFLFHSSQATFQMGFRLFPGEYNLDDYTPSRKTEYAIADQGTMLIVGVLLAICVIGSGLSYLIIRLKLRKTMSPGLFAITGKTLWLKIVLPGLLLPFGIWFLLRFIPLAGRSYSLMTNSLNYYLQGLFLIPSIIILPLTLLRYYIEEKMSWLGLSNSQHSLRHYLTIPLFACILLLIASLVPFYKICPVDFIHSLTAYWTVSSKFLSKYGITEIHWGWMLIAPGITGLFLLLYYPIKTVFLFSKEGDLFKLGCNAAATMIGCSILLLVMLAQSCIVFTYFENYNSRQDRMIRPDYPYVRPYYDILAKQAAKTTKLLEKISSNVEMPEIHDAFIQKYSKEAQKQ